MTLLRQIAPDLQSAFRSLNYRNYRLFFAGQLISFVGNWMQNLAMSWLVYRLTNSAFLLGLVAFAGQIPAFLLSPFGGVLADRVADRRRILVVTQTLSMFQALVLTVFVFTNTVTVWHIVILGVLLSCVAGFDIPTRQTFLLDMVEKKEDLANAIALNSSIFNVARLLGPCIAGAVVAAAGEGFCFLVNTLSFLAAIFSLLAMKIMSPKRTRSQKHVFRELHEGFSYAMNSETIRPIVSLVALISLMGMPYAVLMPIMAGDVLNGTAGTLGFLMSAAGVGALAGAVLLASRKNSAGLGWIIPRASMLMGASLVAFSFSRLIWLSMLLMAATGFGMVTQMASSNTVIQTVVDDNKRGRVMGIYLMVFMGMAPLGSLLAGSLASRIGAPNTILISGLSCLAGGLLFAEKIRH